MTEDHLSTLLTLAEAKKDNKGWQNTAEGRHVTLYISHDGGTLTVGRVEALKRDGELLTLRTVKGETFVVALSDAFAGHVEATSKQSRRAGFA